MDLEWLSWIARHKFVTRRMAMLRFGAGRQAVHDRLRRLTSEDWVGETALPGRAGELIYWAKPRCAPVLGFRPGGLSRLPHDDRHELHVIRRTIELEQRFPNHRFLTERDCRREESAGHGPFSVSSGTSRTHRWPDVVQITPDGQMRAFEFELTQKSKSRYDQILHGYALSQYAEVLYETPSEAAARMIDDVFGQHRRAALLRAGDLHRDRADAQLCRLRLVRLVSDT